MMGPCKEIPFCRQDQLDATYLIGPGNLLKVAYLRKLTDREILRCKTKFPNFLDWWNVLTPEQKERVKGFLANEYLD